MKKYKLVIFDMDGTLADTSPGILNGVRYVQKKLNLPDITLEQMYSHIGPLMEESYHRNFGLTGDKLKRAVELHKEYAVERGYREIQWYNGILELLDTLRTNNIITAIATLKAHETMLKILEFFNMTEKFDIVIGTSPEKHMSKSCLVECCVKKSGVGNGEAVLVGDSIYDADGAADAHVDFIAVTYGFGFERNSALDGFQHVAVCADAFEIGNVIFGTVHK